MQPMPEYIIYKDPDLLYMLASAEHTDGCTRGVFLDLALALYVERGRKSRVTDIWRTVAQQTIIYGGVFQPSGHCDDPCRAIDFTIIDCDQNDRDFIFERHKKYHRLGQYFSLIEHDVVGMHFHVQTPNRTGVQLPGCGFTEDKIKTYLIEEKFKIGH